MSAEKKVKARAKVQVTLEILVDDRWGDGCGLAQVHQQAVDSARGELERLLKGQQHIHLLAFAPTAILTEEDR